MTWKRMNISKERKRISWVDWCRDDWNGSTHSLRHNFCPCVLWANCRHHWRGEVLRIATRGGGWFPFFLNWFDVDACHRYCLFSCFRKPGLEFRIHQYSKGCDIILICIIFYISVNSLDISKKLMRKASMILLPSEQWVEAKKY